MNEGKIQRKYKTETAKKHISIPLQDAAVRHRHPQDVAKRLSCSMSTVLNRLLNDQSTPSMDNKAATVIHGRCFVAASTVDLEVTGVAKNAPAPYHGLITAPARRFFPGGRTGCCGIPDCPNASQLHVVAHGPPQTRMCFGLYFVGLLRR